MERWQASAYLAKLCAQAQARGEMTIRASELRELYRNACHLESEVYYKANAAQTWQRMANRYKSIAYKYRNQHNRMAERYKKQISSSFHSCGFCKSGTHPDNAVS